MKDYFKKIKKMAGINEDPEVNEEQELEQEETTSESTEGSEGSEANGSEESGESEEQDPLTKLQFEHADLKNNYLRLLADFDNSKKRNAKDRLEWKENAGKDVLKDLLPIIDDFKRAFKINEAEDEEEHNEGFLFIYKKLLKMLESRGVTQMDCMGAKFDADLHEAMAEIEAPSEDKKGCVVDIIEDGYYINEKILRYARVVVGK